jgi:hypothetical protein
MSDHKEKSIYDFQKLKGTENYLVWSMRIKQLLVRDKVWDVTIGTRIRPETPEIDLASPNASQGAAKQQDPQASKTYDEQAKWTEACTLAESHIMSALSDTILTSIKEEPAPKLWKRLKETYGRQTSASLHNLKASLASKRLRPDESLRDHFTDLKSKKEVLIKAGGNCSDDDFTFWLLESLTPEYANVVDSIHTMNTRTKLTPDDIIDVLLNKSDRLKTTPMSATSQSNSVTPALTATTAMPAQSIGKRKGTYPSTADFSSNDVPANDGYKKKFKGKGTRAGTGKQCPCGSSGHPEERCWLIHPEKAPQYIKDLRNKKQFFAYFGSCTHAYVTYDLALEASMLHELPKNKWIFDSGASGHMCNDQTSFTSYTAFLPHESHEVELGDGTCIPALGFGTVRIVSYSVVTGAENWSSFETIVYLQDVLFVPSLQINLISQKRLDWKGFRTVIHNSAYMVYLEENLAMVGRCDGGTGDLYTASVRVAQEDDTCLLADVSVDVDSVEVEQEVNHENDTRLLADVAVQEDDTCLLADVSAQEPEKDDTCLLADVSAQELEDDTCPLADVSAQEPEDDTCPLADVSMDIDSTASEVAQKVHLEDDTCLLADVSVKQAKNSL